EIHSPRTLHLYGLGEQLRKPDEADGDWLGDRRTPGNRFGNQMVGFNGGAVSNAQFPVLYGLGSDSDAFALFLDHPYALTWDFTRTPWTVKSPASVFRGYLIGSGDLKTLRARYLALTGMPPVPPKKAFGLWVSEYGF